MFMISLKLERVNCASGCFLRLCDLDPGWCGRSLIYKDERGAAVRLVFVWKRHRRLKCGRPGYQLDLTRRRMLLYSNYFCVAPLCPKELS